MEVYPYDIDLKTKKHNLIYSNNEDAPTHVRIYLGYLNAGISKSGFVRIMMCNILTTIMKEKDISPYDGIYLYACGKIRKKKYSDLLSFYEKMGFSIFAEDSKREEDCYLYLSAPIKKIVDWCDSVYARQLD
jgi:hypothetical protein